MQREDRLEFIRNRPNISVLIIGAGINGVGTFWDLSLQGIDLLLVDRQDFCSGASAASSHMAHGGIRYLENGEFRLVREAVSERNRLIENAPHYVKPLPTTIPIFRLFSGLLNAPLKFLGWLDRPSERGAVVIKAGLLMYDAYTGKQATVPRHRFEGKQRTLQRFPTLNSDILFAATYYDAIINAPERLCLELLMDAEAANAEALAINYMSVVNATGDTVRLQDEVSGECFDIRPQVVINAAGPWIDITNRAMGEKTAFIGGTKGSHLVLDHPELFTAIDGHEFFFENHDGRIVLICPLHNRVLVGTSDIRITDPDEAVITEEEIDYFIEMVDIVFPSIEVNRSHIVYTYSGVRPLPKSKDDRTGQISRDHSIKTVEKTDRIGFPLLNLIGGKWTTFRAFATGATDQTLARLGKKRIQSTEAIKIGGGKEYPQNDSEQKKWLERTNADSSLSEERLRTLLARYGTYAETIAAFITSDTALPKLVDSPLIDAAEYSTREIAFLALHEQVVHLDDLLLRRSLLAMLGQLTAKMLEQITEVVAQALGWSPEVAQQEADRLRKILGEKHRIVVDQGQKYRE